MTEFLNFFKDSTQQSMMRLLTFLMFIQASIVTYLLLYFNYSGKISLNYNDILLINSLYLYVFVPKIFQKIIETRNLNIKEK